jgi:hypothetical protein
MILIGIQFFKKFSGLHFNFEKKKLAFHPYSTDFIKPSPVDGGGSKTKWIVAGVIIGVILLIALVSGIMIWRKRRLNRELLQYHEI